MIHFRRKKGTSLPIAALAAALTVSLGACGSAGGNTSSQSSSAPEVFSAQTQDAETSEAQASAGTATGTAAQESATGAASSSESTAQESGSNILIAYFTAAENSGVDAVASASYTEIDGEALGRLRVIADMIQENVGGDLFSIHTSVVYPADGGELIDYAAQEQSENARPELTTHIENLDQYDTIFIGYPNWWADLPMAVYSFFDEYDFSGKTIIPFNVHNGSRFSRTIQTIEELEPDATVIENGFTVNERDVADAAGDVASWLQELGY